MLLVGALLVCVGGRLLLASADSLPAPTISLIPSYGVYYPGESVTIMCTVPGRQIARGFQYFKGGMITQQVSDVYMNAYNYRLPGVDMNSAASYTCSYWRTEHHGWMYSAQSLPVLLTITDVPAAPTLSLTTNQTVYKGQQFTLICSLTVGDKARGFHIFKDGNRITERRGTSPQKSYNYNFPSGIQEAGSFTCTYWVDMLQREVFSAMSQPLVISPLDVPPGPSISLTPPYAVYVRGESVKVTCSAPAGYTAKEFQYLKTSMGQDLKQQMMSWSRDAHEISTTDPEAAGSYSCAYWILTSGGWILSSFSDPVLLSVTDAPPGPSISLTPPYPVYVRGESVKVTCSAPAGYTAREFRYLKTSTGQDLKQQMRPWGRDTHEISTTDPEAAGSYSCAYWILTSGRWILSSFSDPVSLSVTGVPPAPAIALTPPYPMYVRGESVTVTCSAPADYTPRGFRYFKRGELREVPSQSSYTHKISTSDQEAAGSYSCAYWIETSGRRIQSFASRTLAVSVTDPLISPRLSLDPADGKVTDGGNVTLNCSAPDGYDNLTFYLLGEDLEISGRSPDLGERTILFSFPVTLGNYSQDRNYSCHYEASIGGRSLKSNHSDLAQLMVFPETQTGPVSALQHWYYLAGGAAAFLIFLILILLIRGAKKGGTPPISSSSQEDYTYVKRLMLTASLPAPELEPVARNEHVYSEIDAPETSPALYAMVKSPQPVPTYSTVDTSRSARPHSTVHLPPCALTYSTVGLPPSAPTYSTVGLPQSAPTYSTVGLPPSAPMYSTVGLPQSAPTYATKDAP